MSDPGHSSLILGWMSTLTVTIGTLVGLLSLRKAAEAAIWTGRTMKREGVGEVFITPPGDAVLNQSTGLISAAAAGRTGARVALSQ